jgi:hypothetical protein
MTFLEVAEKVLRENNKPLSLIEIWGKAIEKGYDKLNGTKGLTPIATLGAHIYWNMKNKSNSVFIKVGKNPVKFFLKELSSAESAKAIPLAYQGMSFLDLAERVLKEEDRPIGFEELWEIIAKKGYDKLTGRTIGKTPERSLGAMLYLDIKNNPDSIFVKYGKRPPKFFLKGKIEVSAGTKEQPPAVTPSPLTEIKEENDRSIYESEWGYLISRYIYEHVKGFHGIYKYISMSKELRTRNNELIAASVFKKYSKKVSPELVGELITMAASKQIQINKSQILSYLFCKCAAINAGLITSKDLPDCIHQIYLDKEK